MVQWTPPPYGLVKCNFDAAFDHSSRQAKGGWMVRDHLGRAKYWGCAILGEVSSPIEAEGKALLLAIQNTRFLGFEKVVFEGDCLLLIKHLNGESRLPIIHNLGLDILKWTSSFQRHEFTAIKRSSNEVAHCLAQQGPYNSLFHSSCHYPPVWLTSYLYNDYVRSRLS